VFDNRNGRVHGNPEASDIDTGMRVKIDKILEGMEFQSDTSASYLNRRTGEVVTVSDEYRDAAEDDDIDLEERADWEREEIRLAGEVLESDDYIPLPDRFEIDEYRMMERFSLSVDDERIRDELLRAIRGSGAFRRFKDAVHHHGVAEAWYEFRDRAFEAVAREWCEDNDIEIEE
jgi:hypothetical protein